MPEAPDLEQGLLHAEPSVASAEAVQQLQPQQPHRETSGAGKSDTCGSAEVAEQGTEGRQLLRGARDMALQLVQALERASEAHGYNESLLTETSNNSNETFTDRCVLLLSRGGHVCPPSAAGRIRLGHQQCCPTTCCLMARFALPCSRLSPCLRSGWQCRQQQLEGGGNTTSC